MNVREQSVIHHAVAFFDGGELVKEMLSVEFEAVLDQVVGLPEFADREVRACYLRINQRLQIVGAVFFLVDFDSRGFVNRSWNIPLQHLLDSAARGPDLGAGRIRLVCRSQCPLSWYQRQLWDPDWTEQTGSFGQLQESVLRNRLGLPVDPDRDEMEELSEPSLLRELEGQYEQRLREHREQLAAQATEHRLQLAALQSAMQEQIEQLHQRYQMQLSQMRESLESAKQLFMDEKRRHQALKDSLDSQADELREAREQLQWQLARERGGDADLERLQQHFELELRTRLEQSTAGLREMLDMREVELFYREEQLGTLREEVARLRQEREQLISLSGDRLLQRLAENGVTFVAYQPGAEAMTLPVTDIPRYLESPQDYAAERCAVAPDHFRLWLDHYQLPLCGELLPDGSICGEPVVKIERPAAFLAGVSDRCQAHAGSVSPADSAAGAH